MINQVTLVGRLVKTPELFFTETGKSGSFITLAVGRPYKNIDGEYETDFLDCTLWTGIAENTAEYCKTGDIIGIRGRLQSRIVTEDDGQKYKKMEIIADRVTFLSSASKKDNDTEERIIEPTEKEEKVKEENRSTNTGKSSKKK